MEMAAAQALTRALLADRCPACTREISSDAAQGPYCGDPIAQKRNAKMQNIASLIMIAALALIWRVWVTH